MDLSQSTLKQKDSYAHLNLLAYNQTNPFRLEAAYPSFGIESLEVVKKS
jgi:hypothetical protein